MDTIEQLQEEILMEDEMGDGLKSYIPGLLEREGWSEDRFVAFCILRGLSGDTAKRLVRGETNITTKTLAIIAQVLEVESISDVMDLNSH